MPTALQHRRLQSENAAVATDAGDRTADLIFTTGAAVTRMDWMSGERYSEVLSLDPKHVDLERLQRGAPLLAVHNQYDLNAVIGVTESATVSNGMGTAKVRFANTPEGDKALALVRDKILRNVSVGYIVNRYEKTDAADGGLPIWRAISWTPCEISIVPVPADPGAQIRGQSLETAVNDQPLNRKELNMPQPNDAVRAERERVNEINMRCRHAKLDQDFADHLVNTGASVDAACRAITDELAERHTTAPINPTRTDHNGGTPAAIVEDMAAMLHARYGGPAPSDAARRFSSMRITDMARALLDLRGISTHGLSRDDLIQRGMHSTSDFTSLLENVGGKVLRQSYQAAPPGVKAIARQVLARDFKPMSRVQLSESPALQKVLEGGEFKRGKMIDAKESYSIETFGRIFGITRQALVNDDLGAFSEMGRRFGQAAAEFERSQLTALFTTNGTMADTGALFNATAITTAGGHANLGTGAGSALSATGLAAGTKAMRTAKGLDKVTPINVSPRFLIVPAALEYTAMQLVTAITPSTSSEVNPYAGKLEVIVDARLDASSTTAWYLAADPGVIDGLEYAYLEDAPGPQLFTDEGWDRDGVEWKIRLDFGCAAVEFRSLYKANGA